MKIIQRYTLREFIEAFVFGILVFSGLLMLDQVFQLINLVLGKGVSVFIVIKLFFLVLPNVLTLTIPMSVLFAILLSFGRLSEDNEVTALRSTGFSYFSFTYPIVVSIFLLSVFLLNFNQNIAPKTHKEFRSLFKAILATRPLVKFEEKSMIEINNYRIYTNKIDKTTNVLLGINIYKFPSAENDDSSWRISATSATVNYNNKAVTFLLSNGNWQKPETKRPEKTVQMKFNSYRFVIPFQDTVANVSQSLKEMTGSELLSGIRASSKDIFHRHFLETEFWLRYTLAFAPFVFAFIGIPLGIVVEKSAKAISFGLSLLILFGYYVILITCLNISEKGVLSPGIILWVPNVMVFAAGLFLWNKMSKK